MFLFLGLGLKERAELVVHMNSEAVQRIFGREMDAEAATVA